MSAFDTFGHSRTRIGPMCAGSKNCVVKRGKIAHKIQAWPTHLVANNRAYLRAALTRLPARSVGQAAAVLGGHSLDAAVELGGGEGVEEGVDGRVDGQDKHRYPGVQRRWRKHT